MDRKLLDLIVCPATRQPLLLLSTVQLEALNTAIGLGSIKTAEGDTQRDPIREGLITRNGTTIYRIDDGIPVLLVESSITTSQIADFPGIK